MDSENFQSVRAETDPLVKAVAAGHAALLITGNVHDFTLKGGEAAYRPQLIADELAGIDLSAPVEERERAIRAFAAAPRSA